jgi:NAD(P)-dependent dehydrogenase (short-subunit alcohol dehydrogenase family)
MATTKRVTIVTGANGALGSAIASRLEADGGGGVIALERSKTGEVALERAGERLLRLRADTNDVRALSEALTRAETELGPATGAVLTAGAWRGGHTFVDPESAADYRLVMDANLESAQIALRAILPRLVERQGGSVVLIGSRAGVRPFTASGDAAYAAAKAALTALAQAIAAEVLQAGVRVNVVMPSTIDTEANRQAMPTADASRWVTTDSLGDVITFLLSDQARDISGAAIPVYGRVNV